MYNWACICLNILASSRLMRLFTALLSQQASSPFFGCSLWTVSPSLWGKGQDGTLIKCQLDTGILSINWEISVLYNNPPLCMECNWLINFTFRHHWWQHRGSGRWFAIFSLRYPSKQSEDKDNSMLGTCCVIMDAEGWGGHCNWPREILH